MNKELKDGDDLGGGIVYSNKGGHHVAVYRCKCGREQTARHEMLPGGITPQAAINVGWVKTDAGWSCPFCDGDEDKLRSAFDAC